MMKSAAEYAALAESELRRSHDVGAGLRDWYVARAAVYATLCMAAPIDVVGEVPREDVQAVDH